MFFMGAMRFMCSLRVPYVFLTGAVELKGPWNLRGHALKGPYLIIELFMWHVPGTIELKGPCSRNL